MTLRVRRRVALRCAAVVCGVALTAGCADGRRLAEGVVGEQHEAPFYAIPDPLPAGAPGTIIRSEPLPQGPAGAVAWRVLYHSRDRGGADIAVSGVVVAPASPAPPGGRLPIPQAGHGEVALRALPTLLPWLKQVESATLPASGC